MAKSYKRYIETLVAKFQEYFHLSQWDIIIEYESIPDDDGDVYASCHADPAYYRCVLTLCPPLQQCFQREKAKIVKIMCHEFVHIVTRCVWNMAWEATPPVAQDHARLLNEQQTQHLCQIILQSLPKSFYEV